MGARPHFFVVAEDLGKFLPGLHKAGGRMDEINSLGELNTSLLSLNPGASTQKVLADEASSRNPPRSSQRQLDPRPSETAYPYHRS
jgi:hypothetical protein